MKFLYRPPRGSEEQALDAPTSEAQDISPRLKPLTDTRIKLSSRMFGGPPGTSFRAAQPLM
eukprot:8042640-Pyramimonas_sp.AAC.1